jgi:hypothetical protein
MEYSTAPLSQLSLVQLAKDQPQPKTTDARERVMKTHGTASQRLELARRIWQQKAARLPGPSDGDLFDEAALVELEAAGARCEELMPVESFDDRPLELSTSPCPKCRAYEWWIRPDLSRICGACVKAAGARGHRDYSAG